MKHLKQEFDKLSFKEVLIYALAILSQCTAFVLVFLGMYIAPEGEIHDSVLTAFGITLLMVSSLLGVSLHYGFELNKFKSKVSELLMRLERKEGENGEL